PVLTKPATEVASRRAKREYARARQKMIQRFLFNRIDTKPAAPAIGGQHYLIGHPLPDETESALPFVQLAKPRTQPALDASIGQHRPPPRSIIRLRQRGEHLPNIAEEIRNAGINSQKFPAFMFLSAVATVRNLFQFGRENEIISLFAR